MKASEGKRSSAVARKVRQRAAAASRRRRGRSVTFRHVEPTEAIRVYAERKLAHLPRSTCRRACEVHLILTVDKYRQHGEVTVKSGRLAVTAQEETKDLYSVIDLLADKVERPAEKASWRKKRARKCARPRPVRC